MAWFRDWRHIEWIGYHHSPDNTTEDHMSDQPEPVTTQPEDDNPGDLVGQELTADGLDSDGVPDAVVEVQP